MKRQLNRISSFIESLEGEQLNDQSQSFLLQTDLSSIGGSNGGDCKNSSSDACNKVNGGACENSNNSCQSATNLGACKNIGEGTETPPPSTNTDTSCN